MLMRPLAVVALASNSTAEDGGVKTDASQDGPKTTDSSSPPSPTQACQDRATAQCALQDKCRPTTIETNYGSEAACVSGVQQNCENSLAAPSNGNTATFVEACAKAFSSWSCDDFENDVNIPTACQQKTGSLESGKGCAFPGQCKTGFCAIPPDAQCGVCADPPKAGASCANLTTCGQGLTCAAKTQTCATFSAKGDACGEGEPCGYQLSCVGANAKDDADADADAGSDTGTCQAAVETVGDTCDPTQNKSAGCDLAAGLTCDATTKKCVKFTFAKGKEACGNEALCSAGGTCTSKTDDAGTCIPAAAEGEICDEGNSGTGCLNSERCIASEDGGASGTCEFANAAKCK
jgi:hypothetical protein